MEIVLDFLSLLLSEGLIAIIKFIVYFTVSFGGIMLAFLGIGKLWEKFGKTQPEPSPPPQEPAETPEYIQHICEITRLLSDDDTRLSEILPLFSRDKVRFTEEYLPQLDAEDAVDFDYWTLMRCTLDEFGYVSEYDWKDTLPDALSNLDPVLDHYGIECFLFDDIPDAESIREPEISPTIASRLPVTYLLVDIYTGEDSYSITVAPVKTVEKAVAIVKTMDLVSHHSGIRVVSPVS